MVEPKKDTYLITDSMVEKFQPGGRYQLVIVASKRAHDLQRGKQPLIDDWEGHKFGVIALKEIEAGLIPPTYPHGFVDPHDIEEEEENA